MIKLIMKGEHNPVVSVVIATKNEKSNIARCLKSLQSQTFPQKLTELIVIDNHSTDLTRSIAKKYTNHVYTLSKSTPNKIQNFRGAQLNFAVRKSRGKIIFFPDADMTFDPGLIDEAVKLVNTEKLDALYIPEVIIGKGFLGKIRNFERSFYNETVIDSVRLVKKELFDAVRGFDTRNIMFGPDDWDFTKRIKIKGAKIGITQSKKYHHEAELGLLQYLAKKGKYTSTFEGYINKWTYNDPDVLKQFGFYYRYIGVYLEHDKWKKLIQNPFLAIGMYCIRGIIGALYLIYKISKKKNDN